MIRKEIRQTLHLAGPMILAQLAQMSMTFVDSVMVGWLGTRQLAGVALGGAGLRGRRSGRHQGRRETRTVAGDPAERRCFSGPVAGLLAAALGGPRRRETIVLAEGYLRAITWGVVPHLWFAVLRYFVEGLSRPRVVLIITAAGLLLNVGANYILMYGKLGFPALGLVGCGWASTLVYWTMFLVMVLFILKSDGMRPYRVLSRLGRPDWHRFSEVFRIGWPIGGMQGFEVGLFSATALLMGPTWKDGPCGASDRLAMCRLQLHGSTRTFPLRSRSGWDRRLAEEI